VHYSYYRLTVYDNLRDNFREMHGISILRKVTINSVNPDTFSIDRMLKVILG